MADPRRHDQRHASGLVVGSVMQAPYGPQTPNRRPAIVGVAVVLVLVAAAVAIATIPSPTPGPNEASGSAPSNGVSGVSPSRGPSVSGTSTGSVTILGSKAASLDPAVQSDAGSAQVVAQLFETLTAIDAAGHIQPALAQSWTTSSDGRSMTFELRPDLRFSDGSALTAPDVVASWMRVLDPSHPSQLASLLDDVVGARAYQEGSGAKSAVGLSAPSQGQVAVEFLHPASDFPAIVSSPTLAVVPSSIDQNPSVLRPGSFVGSGGYVVSAVSDTETTMTANPYYWAGPPPIKTIHLLNSIGGKSPVSEFENGNLDYTPISVYDASWIAYDKTLGPDLRIEPSPTVEYYGFDASKAPFSNVHVRRAFQLGIDWERLVQLEADPLTQPATGMVPPSVPGAGNTDFGPVFDLTRARAELAAAGYAGGAGFPKVTLVTPGGSLDEAIVKQVHDNLGIDLGYMALDWTTYNDRLLTDPPAFWWMGWVADYPGANDFLGLLLGTGKTNNFGRWSSSDFDMAIDQALAATDAQAAQQAYDRAQAVILDQAPVIPVDYSSGYSLSNPKLLGALPNGVGMVRYAGLAWAD
jgi:oligopeptide transport system substrate-binding protein